MAHMENLPSNWKKHYNRTLKIMRPYLDGDEPKKAKKNREEYILEFIESVDYTEYLHKCHENVVQTDYFINRGLSQETIDKFKLGYDSEKNLVLDLGCGTGTLTELLYQKGYDMIGVDYSEEMLGIALEKKESSGSEILYLCQDMRELDLYSTVGTVVCVCDSVNYLLENDEVEETFALVNNYLYPGGLFIFDFNTVYKYEKVIGDAVIAENRDACSFIWENYYHGEERLNEYDLTIFVQEEGELFRRFTETHFQRGYTLEEMKGFVEKAGMEIVLVLDADTRKEPEEKSERIYIAARECQK